MNSLGKLFLFLTFTLVACSPAKSPIDGASSATFAVYPDKVTASAELDRTDALGNARHQVLHFTVCLQNTISGQAVVADVPFSIHDGQGGGKDRKTDISGCLHWDEEHDLAPLESQANLIVKRQIEGQGSLRGTVPLTFKVAPWADGSGAVESVQPGEKVANAIGLDHSVGFTGKYPTPESTGLNASQTSDGSSSKQIELASDAIEYDFRSLGPAEEYELDRYLNLTVPYHYLLTFSPLVTHRLLSGQQATEPMHAGRLRVTIVLFASGNSAFKNDDHYLTSAQVEGEVKANGKFTTDMFVVKYPHVLMASGRQTLLIQITPVDNVSGLAAKSFSGKLDYVQQQGNIVVVADGRDAEAIHLARSRERREAAIARSAPLDSFREKNPDVVLNPNVFPATAPADDGGGWRGYFQGWRDLLLSQAELLDALDHEKLNSSNFNGGKTPARSVAERLCQAYVEVDFATNNGWWNRLDRAIMGDPAKDAAPDQYLRGIQSAGAADRRDSCTDAARSHVSVRQLDFIDSFTSAVPFRVKTVTPGNAEFAVYWVHEDSDVYGGGFGFNVPFANFADIHWVHNWMKAYFNGGRYSVSATMSRDYTDLSFEARVNHCVVVTGDPKMYKTKPWMFCNPHLSLPVSRDETFENFTQIFTANNSPMSDKGDQTATTKVLIRNKFFSSRVTDSIAGTDLRNVEQFHVFVHSHIPNMAIWNTMQELDGLTEQDVAGAINRN